MNAVAPTPQIDRIEHTPPVGVRWHPYAELFPWIEGSAFEELKADIAKNGVIEPIVFVGDAILDGRNRYMAARDLGIDYPRVEYRGDDPLGFVIARNLARRHLSESQRAMVAAKLAKLPPHRPATDNSANLRTSDVAERLNVSSRSVETARAVDQKGIPELAKAVESGAVSVSAAAAVATLPQPEQERIVSLGPDEIVAKAVAMRAAKKAKPESDPQHEAERAMIADRLPESVKRQEQAKAEAKAAAKAKSGEEQAFRDRIDELEEGYAAVTAENASLKSEITRFDEMRIQWEQGGFEAVIAAKDEEIRVLLTRVERESKDKASWKRSSDYWKSEAVKLGFSSTETIDIETGEVIDG